MALGRREGKDDAGCPDSTAEDSPWMMALDTHRTLRHVPGHGSSLLQEEAGQSFLYTIIYNTFFLRFHGASVCGWLAGRPIPIV